MNTIKKCEEENIHDLRQIIDNFVHERNWKTFHKPQSLAAAISIESAELLENFLFKPLDFIPEDITNITDEMADIFIYLMCLANELKIPNFSAIIRNKIHKNELKYPKESFSGEKYKKQ